MESKILEIVNDVHPNIENVQARTDLDDILDSLDIIQLIGILEDEFDAEIDPDDIVPENFSSVLTICGMVDKARA